MKNKLRINKSPHHPPVYPNLGSGRLAALTTYHISTRWPSPCSQLLLRWLRQYAPPLMAAIGQPSDDSQWFKAACGLGLLRQASTENPFLSPTMEGAQNLLESNDACTNPCYAMNPMVTGRPGLCFHLSSPPTKSENHRARSLCAIDQQPWPLTYQPS
jgi:hypothetical protein